MVSRYIPLTYCWSLIFENGTSAQVGIAVLHFLTGFILLIGNFVLSNVESTHDTNAVLRQFFYRLFPPFCFGEALINLTLLNYFSTIALENAQPFTWHVLGLDMVWLSAHCLVYTGILLLLQTTIPQYVAHVIRVFLVSTPLFAPIFVIIFETYLVCF